MLETLAAKGYDILAKNHASAILTHDFPDELSELADVLLRFQIQVSEIISGG